MHGPLESCMVLHAPRGPEGPPDQTPPGELLETGVELDLQPATKPGRVEFLRVRSLRTQQRAESQCQVRPRAGAFGFWFGIPLVD